MAAPAVQPFTIAIPEVVLTDLRDRLRRTRWTDEVNALPWRYGPPLAYMRHIVEYWLDSYDWRAQEQRLNTFQHAQTEIRGLPIHFLHHEGLGPDPMPIVITHGWPGSFVEMLDILPLLTDPVAHGGNAEDAFTVVVPSIPGHGFSGRSIEEGMNYSVVADMWVELMDRLGYGCFGAQGGDWGSWISAAIAQQHPERIKGLHLNFLSTRFRPGVGPDDPAPTAEEQAYLEKVGRMVDDGGAYFAIQSTRPLTLSYGLSDSPVGLAAWMLEKFQAWSGCSDVPEEAIPLDDLITNIMIYWVTNTAHSAARFYAGARQRPFHLEAGQKVSPPCGVVRLPREMPMPPRSWAERAFNIVHWTTLPKGGHFAALEQPALLADDIRAFFRPLRASPNGSAARGGF